MLTLQKSSPRSWAGFNHPSAMWAVKEIPGIILAREWMPDTGHTRWVVLFDQFLDDDRLRRPWYASVDGEEDLVALESQAEKIFKELSQQSFSTRCEALQSIQLSFQLNS